MGVPELWIPVIKKAGFASAQELKKANPNKLLNDLGGLRKKMKLDIQPLKIEEIKSWM